MRDRGLARALVLILGALAGSLAFSFMSSARAAPGRDLFDSRMGSLQPGDGGRHSAVGVTARDGPSSLGGGSPGSLDAGGASGATGSTSVVAQPTSGTSAPVTYQTQPVPSSNAPAPVTYVAQPVDHARPTVTSPQAVTSPTQFAPPSPRRLPQRSRGRGVTTAAPPVAVPVAAPISAAAPVHTLTPVVSGHRGFFDTVIQGQNASIDAEAISGDVEAVNELDVEVGPFNGQQFGNNRVRIDQESFAFSGSAIAGSQVFAGGRGFFGHPFFDDDFFDDDDDDFFDDPFFFRHPFHHRFHFPSHIRLHHLEILADMAESCLDRLEHRPSHALFHICEHRLERLADELEEFSVHGHFFGFGDVFFSRGGTHALFGFGGAAITSGRRSVLVGPLGVSVAGPGGAASFGFGGFASTFPHGSASSEDVGNLLFAPFGLSSGFHSGFHHGHHHAFAHGRSVRGEIAHLRHAFLHLREWLDWLHHHHHAVLGTIHAHSFFDHHHHPVFFSPFGHRTVFIADDAVFVPHNPHFFFDDDDLFFRTSHVRHRHNLRAGDLRRDIRRHLRRIRRHRHHHHDPVFDIPGLGAIRV